MALRHTKHSANRTKHFNIVHGDSFGEEYPPRAHLAQKENFLQNSTEYEPKPQLLECDLLSVFGTSEAT
jgi:hypothetical protein